MSRDAQNTVTDNCFTHSSQDSNMPMQRSNGKRQPSVNDKSWQAIADMKHVQSLRVAYPPDKHRSREQQQLTSTELA